MAANATFAQSRVLKNERQGLLPMALGAVFIQARHREAAFWFHDIQPMRIMALNAVHFAFGDRMMLGKTKGSADLEVTLEAGFGILARIDDKLFETAPAAHGNVFAAWTMARLATALAGHSAGFHV